MTTPEFGHENDGSESLGDDRPADLTSFLRRIGVESVSDYFREIEDEAPAAVRAEIARLMEGTLPYTEEARRIARESRQRVLSGKSKIFRPRAE